MNNLGVWTAPRNDGEASPGLRPKLSRSGWAGAEKPARLICAAVAELEQYGGSGPRPRKPHGRVPQAYDESLKITRAWRADPGYVHCPSGEDVKIWGELGPRTEPECRGPPAIRRGVRDLIIVLQRVNMFDLRRT